MGKAYLVRRGSAASGGNGLHVIVSSDARMLPAIPENNTIALITDMIIGSAYIQSVAPGMDYDGVAFIPTGAPEKTLMLEGTTAVRIGISGAYVKRGDAWEYADTYLYADGTWHFLWSGQLYDAGNEYEDYTGGYAVKAMRAASNSTATAAAPTLSHTGYSMIADTMESKSGGIIYTAEKIDLTPYKTVVFEGDFSRGGSTARNFTTAAWKSFGSYYTSNVAASETLANETGTKIELDVSDVEEACYIGIGLTNSTAEITRCYLLPKAM